MTIPSHLDTFVTDTLVFEPQLAINRRTMEPAIFARVIDRQSGRVIETRLFQEYGEYLAFVEQRAMQG